VSFVPVTPNRPQAGGDGEAGIMLLAAGINAWPEWRLMAAASRTPTGSATELPVRAPVPRQPDNRDWRAERRLGVHAIRVDRSRLVTAKL
jgi:hypothetical protein